MRTFQLTSFSFFFVYFKTNKQKQFLRWWWCRASCPRTSVDILGTNCDQCLNMVQCCFTSTETVRLIRTESPGWPLRLSHSSWTLSWLGDGTNAPVSDHAAIQLRLLWFLWTATALSFLSLFSSLLSFHSHKHILSRRWWYWWCLMMIANQITFQLPAKRR